MRSALAVPLRGLRSVVLRAACIGFGIVSAAEAAAETVSVLTASPESEAAARYFTRQIDEMKVVRRTSTHVRNLDALIIQARAEWRDDFVVIVDAERAIVSVVRPRDGTMGSRALAASAAKAPYAVALAAIELLDIVRSAPRARAAALPETQPEAVATRLSLDLGLVQSVSVTGDVGLLQPTAGVDLELQGTQGSLWFAVGIHGTGLSPMRRGQPLLLPEGPDNRGVIEYSRNELSTRGSVGHRRGDAAASLGVDLGVAFVETTARDRDGEAVATDSRRAFWLGLSGDLRYSLGYGFALGVGAGAAWFPVATRFFASPRGGESSVVAFDEGQVDFRARLALFWGATL